VRGLPNFVWARNFDGHSGALALLVAGSFIHIPRPVVGIQVLQRQHIDAEAGAPSGALVRMRVELRQECDALDLAFLYAGAHRLGRCAAGRRRDPMTKVSTIFSSAPATGFVPQAR